MTRKEYNEEYERLNSKLNEIKNEISKLRETYFTEVLERNGYHIGDKISSRGKDYEIACVDTNSPLLWVMGRPLKKDGTPSKKMETIYGIHFNQE